MAHLRQPTHFKTALPLYRRLQFGRFLDSSYLFTNLHLDDLKPNLTADENTLWFYAFVDRGCRPETEVWLFGSWEVEVEVEAHPASETVLGNENKAKADKSRDEAICTLLLDFIKSIKSMETPPSIHRPEDVLAAQTQLATANKDTTKPKLPDPNILLLGALHSLTLPHLHSLSLLSPPLLPPTPTHTFHFPLSALPPPASLPPNLRWGKLSPTHFPLVRSRTEIARQDYTLTRLPSLAIFPVEPEDAAPVAWCFVGLDGSLTTLHTEPEFRRLGFGSALSARVFREGMGRFWEGEEVVLDGDGNGAVEERLRLAHGNVAVGNEKSAGMCRRLGGREGSVVYWVTVDLGRV